ASHYVLVEAENATDDALAEWMTLVGDQGLFLDGTLAQSGQQAAELWALREGISESLSATGLPHKNDVSLPIARLEDFCGELDSVFARDYAGWEICLFGHIGDGNLHVNVMKPDALDVAAFRARTAAADRDLFTLVQKYDGSISAEHGIGLLKKAYLGYSRSADEIAVLRAVKRALDPEGLMNPGKILD
ncbi:MAG: FAD-linked oxidase, partial [Myxococcales bacterium]|nr:FAD-linked oxidase [Myxococcales bacterium]